jgi:hypothetical protein
MQSRGNAPVITKPRYAIILHFFYLDLWAEVQKYLHNMHMPFDLYITTPTENYALAKQLIHSDFPEATIFSVPNQGRDIAPFFHVTNIIDIYQYTAICKIHTKKSFHVDSGPQWRNDLYEKLLGAPELISSILNTFDSNPLIGMIAPEGHIVPFKNYFGGNKKHISQLLTKLNLPFEKLAPYFIAGDMFWFRPQAIQTLTNLHLTYSQFELETGQTDGTLAHAIERLFFPLVKKEGFWIVSTNMTTELAHQSLDNSSFLKLLDVDNGAIASSHYYFFSGEPYTWHRNHFDNGMAIKDIYKVIYNTRPDLKTLYPNPYKTEGDQSYLFWIYCFGHREYSEVENISGQVAFFFDNNILFDETCCAIYAERPDLQRIYPNPLSIKPNESFFWWLITQGQTQYPELIHFRQKIDFRFDNNVTFNNKCWDIYLSRPDLQKKYPNPFSTSEDNHFFKWLTTQGPLEYHEVKDWALALTHG